MRHVKRQQPAHEGMGLRRESTVAYDPSIQQLIYRLTAPIHNDPDRLRSEFVSASSDVELPETAASSLPSLSSIDNTIRELSTFFESARGDGDGRIIVGEKGVGKTTVTHYAHLAYQRVHAEAVLLGVDYQWVGFYEAETALKVFAEEFFRLTGETRVSDPTALAEVVRSARVHGDLTDSRVRGRWPRL
jgi:hypothetical protein